MPIDRKEVEHIARLARLELSDEEVELYAEQLSKIIDYVNKLRELDTDDVEPMVHVLDVKNVFREDEVKPSLPPEEVLKNAPDTDGRFFKVPKVIEG